jgi:hypothetical protein
MIGGRGPAAAKAEEERGGARAAADGGVVRACRRAVRRCWWLRLTGGRGEGSHDDTRRRMQVWTLPDVSSQKFG